MLKRGFGLTVLVGLAFLALAVPHESDSVITADDNSVAPNLLEVKVYYETLCPDSMQFIIGQLYPAMIYSGWLNRTDLKFVPYGKVAAWTDPLTSITSLLCQHGEAECENNALHACIVEQNLLSEQMEMINCLMRGYSINIKKCASELNIDVTDALNCKKTRKTSDILKKYGDDTDSIDISFVPSIAIDGEFVRTDQNRILYSFATFFCEKYRFKYGVQLPNCPQKQ